MAGSFEAFHLPTGNGERFCIYHPPAARPRAARGIVYVHPFAEEMNKSRRMAALQARRFAAVGIGVLQVDLHGCGDSRGEFGDARWQTWKQDVLAGVRWLAERVEAPVGLWGLRLGATLAAEIAAERSADIGPLILWQPVAGGEQFVTQFLRLHLASEMLSAGTAQTGVGELRKRLAQGTVLEIGGYELHPDLAGAIEKLKLAELAPEATTVHWLEVSAQPDPQLGPASRRVVDAWRARAVDVRAAAVQGEPFWSTVEITECAALLDATDASVKDD